MRCAPALLAGALALAGCGKPQDAPPPDAARADAPATPAAAIEPTAAMGEQVFKRCAACHTIDKGGANKVGPNLYGVVTRPVASHEGFAYSGAMKEFSQGGSVVWDYDHLDHFLLSPKGLVKGTAMGFAGLKNPKERADLIAYLRTLADSPAPLPEVPAAPAPENASSPAETPPAQPAAPAEAAPAAPAESAPAAPAPAAPAENAPAAPAPAQ